MKRMTRWASWVAAGGLLAATAGCVGAGSASGTATGPGGPPVAGLTATAVRTGECRTAAAGGWEICAPASVATGVMGSVAAATTQPAGGAPRATSFLLQGYPVTSSVVPPAQVNLYAVEEYRGRSPAAAAQLDALQGLLKNQPVLADQRSLPWLPVETAGQTLTARARYQDFGWGSGISYLSYVTQNPVPLTATSLQWRAVALSNDGRWLVSATAPVRVDALPAQITPEAMAAVQQPGGLQRYLEQTKTTLAAVPPAGVVPAEADLTALVQSLSEAAAPTR